MTRYGPHPENECSEPNRPWRPVRGFHKTRLHAAHHSHLDQNLDYRECDPAEYPGLTKLAQTTLSPYLLSVYSKRQQLLFDRCTRYGIRPSNRPLSKQFALVH